MTSNRASAIESASSFSEHPNGCLPAMGTIASSVGRTLLLTDDPPSAAPTPRRLRLRVLGLAGIHVERSLCRDFKKDLSFPAPPHLLRAVVTVSDEMAILGSSASSKSLQLSPTGETDSAKSDPNGKQRLVAVWSRSQPVLGVTLPQTFGSGTYKQLDLVVGLAERSTDAFPVGTCTLPVSYEEKTIVDLPVRQFNPSFGEEKKDSDGFSSASFGQAYSMDPSGDAILRVEVELVDGNETVCDSVISAPTTQTSLPRSTLKKALPPVSPVVESTEVAETVECKYGDDVSCLTGHSSHIQHLKREDPLEPSTEIVLSVLQSQKEEPANPPEEAPAQADPSAKSKKKWFGFRQNSQVDTKPSRGSISTKKSSRSVSSGNGVSQNSSPGPKSAETSSAKAREDSPQQSSEITETARARIAAKRFQSKAVPTRSTSSGRATPTVDQRMMPGTTDDHTVQVGGSSVEVIASAPASTASASAKRVSLKKKMRSRKVSGRKMSTPAPLASQRNGPDARIQKSEEEVETDRAASVQVAGASVEVVASTLSTAEGSLAEDKKTPDIDSPQPSQDSKAFSKKDTSVPVPEAPAFEESDRAAEEDDNAVASEAHISGHVPGDDCSATLSKALASEESGQEVPLRNFQPKRGDDTTETSTMDGGQVVKLQRDASGKEDVNLFSATNHLNFDRDLRQITRTMSDVTTKVTPSPVATNSIPRTKSELVQSNTNERGNTSILQRQSLPSQDIHRAIDRTNILSKDGSEDADEDADDLVSEDSVVSFDPVLALEKPSRSFLDCGNETQLNEAVLPFVGGALQTFSLDSAEGSVDYSRNSAAPSLLKNKVRRSGLAIGPHEDEISWDSQPDRMHQSYRRQSERQRRMDNDDISVTQSPGDLIRQFFCQADVPKIPSINTRALKKKGQYWRNRLEAILESEKLLDPLQPFSDDEDEYGSRHSDDESSVESDCSTFDDTEDEDDDDGTYDSSVLDHAASFEANEFVESDDSPKEHSVGPSLPHSQSAASLTVSEFLNQVIVTPPSIRRGADGSGPSMRGNSVLDDLEKAWNSVTKPAKSRSMPNDGAAYESQRTRSFPLKSTSSNVSDWSTPSKVESRVTIESKTPVNTPALEVEGVDETAEPLENVASSADSAASSKVNEVASGMMAPNREVTQCSAEDCTKATATDGVEDDKSSVHQSSRSGSRRSFNSPNELQKKSSAADTLYSPRHIMEMPPFPEDESKTFTEVFYNMITCRKSVSHEDIFDESTEGTVPSVLDPHDNRSVGELTATTHEMRVDIERFKQRIGKKTPGSSSAKSGFGSFFKLGGESAVGRISSINTKKEDYFDDYEERAVSSERPLGNATDAADTVDAADATDAAMAKLAAESAMATERASRAAPKLHAEVQERASPVSRAVPRSRSTSSPGLSTVTEEDSMVSRTRTEEDSLRSRTRVEV